MKDLHTTGEWMIYIYIFSCRLAFRLGALIIKPNFLTADLNYGLYLFALKTSWRNQTQIEKPGWKWKAPSVQGLAFWSLRCQVLDKVQFFFFFLSPVSHAVSDRQCETAGWLTIQANGVKWCEKETGDTDGSGVAAVTWVPELREEKVAQDASVRDRLTRKPDSPSKLAATCVRLTVGPERRECDKWQLLWCIFKMLQSIIKADAGAKAC